MIQYFSGNLGSVAEVFSGTVSRVFTRLISAIQSISTGF